MKVGSIPIKSRWNATGPH